MAKASIHFNLPEEMQEFHDAVHAADYKLALWEIAQEIFRPARKHGYADAAIQKILDKTDEAVVVADVGGIMYEVGAGSELVNMLERKFYEILREKGIEL